MIQLSLARYKGVDFLFEDATTTGGNRLLKFNYPASDRQSIERQGEAPASYSMTIVIPHEDYEAKRASLLRVLSSATPGVLVHPTFGPLPNMIPGQFTVNERLSELGRATVTTTFERDDGAGVPQATGDTLSQVQAQSLAVSTAAGSGLASRFKVSSRFPANFRAARTLLTDLSGRLRAITEFGTPIAAEVAAFRADIDAFNGSIGALIQAPANLATELDSLFESVGNLFETPDETFGALRSLLGFGDEYSAVPTDTAGRIERNNNQNAIVGYVGAQTLNNQYLFAAWAASQRIPPRYVPPPTALYKTAEDVAAVQDEIEQRYLTVREASGVNNETLEQLDRLRVSAQQVVGDSQIARRSLITVTVDTLPLSVLAYQYYGSTALSDTLAELNDIQQTAFVTGDVQLIAGFQ